MELKPQNISYRILFLEDNKEDQELMERELLRNSIDFVSKRVFDMDGFILELNQFKPQIILADYTLPSFNGLQAFRLLKQNNVRLPFILVTGSLSEELALECLNEGIDDFILKTSFKRLSTAIVNAIEKKKNENEKETLSNSLKSTQLELRLLLAEVQTAREEERKRIAREIHDELGQVLTALKIDVSLLNKKVIGNLNSELDQIGNEFNSIIKLIDRTIGSVKRIATDLRPEILDDLGVIEAIKWQAKEFEDKTSIKCFIINLQNHLYVNPPLDTIIYRIVQESLTNIARHSGATKVNLMLGVDSNNLLIEINDNGKGISNDDKVKTKSFGLIGMRERVLQANGTFSIKGVPSKGTTILVKIPLEQ